LHPLQKKYEREITTMVEVCHAVAERQYVTSHGGNLSWRVAEDEVLITPTKINKGRLAFNDIVIVGMDRQVRFAADGRKPTGEVYIHVGIFMKRADVKSIIHAHPPWMTAFALSKPEILQKAYLPEPTIEVGPVALAAYATPLTKDLAKTFDPVVMRYNAFLMRNHGVVLLSVEGLDRCFELFEMMENTAKTVAIAEMMGGARPLNGEEVRALDQVIQVRNLPMPGAPGQVKDIAELL